MPRRLSAASPLNVVALATLATFFIAGSQAQATNLFHGVSLNNGTPIVHLPPPPAQLQAEEPDPTTTLRPPKPVP